MNDWYSIIPYSKVVFRCVSTEKSGTFNFFKDNDNITSTCVGGGPQVTQVGLSASCELLKVDATHSGTYTCYKKFGDIQEKSRDSSSLDLQGIVITWPKNFVIGQVLFSSACMCLCVCLSVSFYLDYLKKF